jgi:uncharacterized protein (DUF2147 family)
MRKISAILLLTIGFASLSYANSNAILGVWLTQIKDAKIEIYQKASKYFGRVVWLAEPTDAAGRPKLDKNNPNESLKSRSLMNIDILTGFVYDDGEWTDGTIYDPKDGETYDCKLWIEQGNLMVRGYLGWLYDTKTWTKA